MRARRGELPGARASKEGVCGADRCWAGGMGVSAFEWQGESASWRCARSVAKIEPSETGVHE